MFVPAYDVNTITRPHSIPAGQWVTNGGTGKGRVVGVAPSGALWVCWTGGSVAFRTMLTRLRKLQAQSELKAIDNARKQLQLPAMHSGSSAWARVRAAVATILPWAATVALTVAPLLNG